MSRALSAVSLLLACLLASSAAAQMEEDLIPEQRSFVSPELFALEFRVGPWEPDATGFNNFYKDLGPLLELELEFLPIRIKNVAYFGLAGAVGHAAYSAGALTSDGSRATEESTFSSIPLSVLAVARLDVLPRTFHAPFIFTGKLGYSWVHWDTATGGKKDASGWSHGLRWAAQAALDLDTFEPAAARALDEEWGINHSYLFFELWGLSTAGKSLELDTTSWIAGLGFIF